MCEPLVKTFIKSQIESMGFTVNEMSRCLYFSKLSKREWVEPATVLFLVYPEKGRPGFKCNGSYRKGKERVEVDLRGDWETVRQGLVKHFGRGSNRRKK